VGISNLLASSRAIRAGERENCANCVVKIVLYSLRLRELHIPWSLQSEPDLRQAHESSSRANLLLNMRRGEPKVGLKTGNRHSIRRHPELPHATSAPGGTLPAGLPAPAFPRSNALCSNHEQSNAKSPGGRLWAYAVGAWGNLCQANLLF
jgi:hypothetical protein